MTAVHIAWILTKVNREYYSVMYDLLKSTVEFVKFLTLTSLMSFFISVFIDHFEQI